MNILLPRMTGSKHTYTLLDDPISKATIHVESFKEMDDFVAMVRLSINATIDKNKKWALLHLKSEESYERTCSKFILGIKNK